MHEVKNKDRNSRIAITISVAAFSVSLFLFIQIGLINHKASYEESKMLAKEILCKSEMETEILLSSALMSAQAMEQKAKIFRKFGANRSEIMQMLNATLSRGSDFKALWTHWQPNAFDGKDYLYQNDSLFDKNGTFGIMYYKDNDRIKTKKCKEFIFSSACNVVPYPLQTETILEPYFYKYQNDTKNIYQTTVIVPVLEDSIILGAFGINVDLSILQKKLRLVKVFETGIISLISNKGTIIFHPDATLINKNIESFDNSFINSINKGKEIYTETVSGFSGKKVFRYFLPVNVRQISEPWSIMIEVPVDEAISRSKKLLYIAIFSLFVGFSLIIYLIISIIRRKKDNLTLHDTMKKVEESNQIIKERERNYREIYSSTNETIFLFDPTSLQILDVNDIGISMFGFNNKEEALTCSMDDLISNEPPFTNQAIVNYLEKVNSGDSQVFEWISKKKNGTLFWTEVSLRSSIINGKNIILAIIRDISERKKMEISLQESEEKYRFLMENMNEVVMMADNDDKVLYVNRLFTKKLGYSFDEIIGKTGYEILLDPEDWQIIIDENQKRLKKERNQYEICFRAKNGTKIEFLVSGAPVFDNKGNTIGSIGAMTDITERKKAEKALIESEERYRKLLEAFPDMIIVSDVKGKILFGNKPFEAISGIKAENLPGQNFVQYIHPQDYPMAVKVVDDLVASNSNHSGIFDIRTIDSSGNLHWMNGIIAKVFLNGQLVLQTVARDITEKKRIEQELEKYRNHLEMIVKERTEELRQHIEEIQTTRDSLERQNRELNQLQLELISEKKLIDSLMETIPDSIYFKDAKSRYLKVSKSMQEKLQFNSQEEIIGKTDFDFFTKGQALHSYQLEQQIIKTGKPIIDYIDKETWKNGKVVFNLITKMPLRDANGKITGTFGVSRDISHLIEMEHSIKKQNQELNAQHEELETAINSLQLAQNQLLHSEKMASLGILAAGVAHEINNPLNFINGGILGIENYFNEFLPDHIINVAPLINSVNVGVERASAIVSSLNHYTRRNDFPNLPCDVHSIIDNCLIMLNNQIKNNIQVNKTFESKPCMVNGNEGKLHQVFLNVLTNSLQSIEKHGEILIKTRIEKNYLRIIIKDNGCGISKESLPKIMDPFFTTKEPGKGTGLGLSITYNIIQEHNGTIEFESELNKGTLVTISLPLHKT